MKTILLIALLCVGIALSALAQDRVIADREAVAFRQSGGRSITAALSVAHAASGSGVVSPGCAAKITGGQFAAEGFQAISRPLPTTLGGVTVTVGGIEAQIYHVNTDTVSIIVPDVQRKNGIAWRDVWAEWTPTVGGWSFSAFSIRELMGLGWAMEGLSVPQRSLLRWYPLRVTSPFGNYSGWVAVAPTSPGFYQQTDGETLTPQGVYVTDGNAPRLITAEPIENNKTVLLLNGSGFLRAKSVQVFISSEGDGYWVVQAAFGKFGMFDWMEQVNFQLPPEARGRLTIAAQADAMTSNQVFVSVQ